MTDGIITALIGGAAKVISTIVSNVDKLWRRPPPALPDKDSGPVAQPAAPEAPKPSKKACNLSHKQICDAIEAAPPFHRQKITEEFVGARVLWRTQLSSIHRFTDRAVVYAAVPEGSGIMICRTSLDGCTAFIASPAGTRFVVVGDIASVSRYEAELQNCTFEIIGEEGGSPKLNG